MEIRGEDARRLNLRTLSQAAAFAPQWRAGFGYEFMERPDGYRGSGRSLRTALRGTAARHGLGPARARALKDRQIDLAAGNTQPMG
jgi:glycine betaine/choline ABC-type transport system substrate-binding protein